MKGRRNKYGNRRTKIDGITFDSKREAARWVELRAMEDCGLIAYLQRQVAVKCVVRGVLVATWRADFVYTNLDDNLPVYEDVKGYRTREYLLKKKLVKACHGIDIVEV